MEVIHEFFQCSECDGKDFIRIYNFSLRFHSVNFSESLVYDRLIDEIYQCNNCKKRYTMDQIGEGLDRIKKIHKNTGPITAAIKDYNIDVLKKIENKIYKLYPDSEIYHGMFFYVERPHIIHNDDNREKWPKIYKAFNIPLEYDGEEEPHLCFFDQVYLEGPSKFFKGEQDVETHYNTIVNDYKDAKRLAYEIKDDIYATEQITCSIGIAPNKIIAKIASGMDKPNGLVIIEPAEIKEKLNSLKISEIPGIGKKSEMTFNNYGISNCGDLAKFPIAKLYNKWGKYGLKLWKLVNGYNTEDVEQKFTSRERKSISEERTFFEPYSSWEKVWIQINKSIKTIVSKAKERDMQFRTITLKIRNRNFDTYTRSHSLPCYSISEKHVSDIISKLLNEYIKLNPTEIRLIGVKISNLRKTPSKQKVLTQFFNN